MFSLVVKEGKLALPGGPVRADLGIQDEKIAAIGTDLKAENTIDARGLWVFPRPG